MTTPDPIYEIVDGHAVLVSPEALPERLSATAAQLSIEREVIRDHLRVACAQLDDNQITTAHTILRHAAQISGAVPGDLNHQCPVCDDDEDFQ